MDTFIITFVSQQPCAAARAALHLLQHPLPGRLGRCSGIWYSHLFRCALRHSIAQRTYTHLPYPPSPWPLAKASSCYPLHPSHCHLFRSGLQAFISLFPQLFVAPSRSPASLLNSVPWCRLGTCAMQPHAMGTDAGFRPQATQGYDWGPASNFRLCSNSVEGSLGRLVHSFCAVTHAATVRPRASQAAQLGASCSISGPTPSKQHVPCPAWEHTCM